MRRTLFAMLLATTGLLAATGAAHARGNPHATGQSPSEIRGHWTQERMHRAIPVEKAKPGGGGGPGGGTTTSAASVEVTVAPGSALTAHGKVFFSDAGVDYVCSGTALAGDVVWTAGHCVNEGPGGYYTNFMFVPAYRDGAAPYGTFPAPELLTTPGWQLTGEYGVDAGAAIPTVNEAGQTLTQAVVERTPVFNSVRNQTYSAYGYPAAKRFNGQRMRVCNTAWSRNDTTASPDTMGIPCDMTGGSSGGGWITAGGQLASVVSYGYGSLKNVLFGPHLEVEAQELYDDAKAAAAG